MFLFRYSVCGKFVKALVKRGEAMQRKELEAYTEDQQTILTLPKPLCMHTHMPFPGPAQCLAS